MAPALLQAERLRERLVRGLMAPGPGAPGRRFRLSDDALALDETALGASGDIVAVPTEPVLLLAVELPLPSMRRRLEALPFAVEDRIADPIESVHVALGERIAPQLYLAAVVRHSVMRDWIATLESSAVPAAALVPDALLLPEPPAGHWAVAIVGERALVRSADGTGFAIARSQLPNAWAAGGRPPVVTWSADVAEAFGGTIGEFADRDSGGGLPPIDLRQGLYAYRRPALGGLRRRALTIAAAGVLAHGAIAAADTLVLRHQAHLCAVQTQALIASVLPGIAGGDDAITAAAASLPVSARAGAPDPLLPLLARISSAAGPAGMTRLEYDRQRQQLVLSVEPGSETALAVRLSAAGMKAVAAPGSVVVNGAGA